MDTMHAWRRLGANAPERLVRALLLSIIFLLPIGSVLILSEARADVAGVRNSFAVPVFYLVEGLVVATAAAWGFVRLRDPLRRTALRTDLSRLLPLLGLLGLAAIAILWAPWRMQAGIGLAHLVIAFLLTAMLAHEFRNRTFLHAALWTFAAAAAIQAAWGIAQYLLRHDLGLWWLGESGLAPDKPGIAKVATETGPQIRAYGSLPHPNILAAYLSLAAFWVGTAVFWRNGERSRLRQLGFVLLLALLGAGLLVTFSRAAILTTLVGGLLVASFSWRRWRYLPPAAALAATTVLLIGLALAPVMTHRASLESPTETGLTNRAVGYGQAADMIADQPLGVGAGNFVLAGYALDPGRPAYQYQPVHNVPLLAVSELGVLGGAALAWFVIRLGRSVHRSAARDRRERSVEFMLFAVAAAFALTSLTDHFFWSQPQGLLLTAVLVAALVAWRGAATDRLVR